MAKVLEMLPRVDRLPLRKPLPRAKFEPLAKEIFALKKQLNAVILAHNYQVPEIQDVADYVGDSLGLSQQAAGTKADVIVFCGVHFMAETAKILNPEKIVVLPDKDAGCSLEESCPADNLGAGVMEQAGRQMTWWRGNCYAHVEFRRDSLLALKQQFPEAKVVVHPESLREVRDLADAICSTEKMITYCKSSDARQFVIVTESGIIHRLQKECPGKEFICAPTFDVMKAPTDNCRCSECK